MTNFEIAKEVISEGIDKLLLVDDTMSEIRKEIALGLVYAAEEGFVLVQWPESQEYMEEEWFNEEAVFIGGSEDKTEIGRAHV